MAQAARAKRPRSSRVQPRRSIRPLAARRSTARPCKAQAASSSARPPSPATSRLLRLPCRSTRPASRCLMGYDGFTAGSPTVALPLIMANNSGFYTGIQVQNVGASSTNVTVAYSANNVRRQQSGQRDVHSCVGRLQDDPPERCASWQWQCQQLGHVGKYVGGATITNSANQPLVAIVNQVRPTPALGLRLRRIRSGYGDHESQRAADHGQQQHVLHRRAGDERVWRRPVKVRIQYGPNTAGAFRPRERGVHPGGRRFEDHHPERCAGSWQRQR